MNTSRTIADRIVGAADAATTQDQVEQAHWSYTVAKKEMSAADALRAISSVEAAGRRIRRSAPRA